MPLVTFKEKNGGCRLFVSVNGIHVLPGTHPMSDDDWKAVQNDRSAVGYFARGEIFEAEVQSDTMPPPVQSSEPEHSPEELSEFCRTISGMKVEDAEALIVGLESKDALITLMAKDNREAIKEICEARIRVL